MIKINVVAVGKVKENYFLDGIKEYAKRLGRFCEFSITEVPEENYSKVDEKLIEKIKEKEATAISSHLKGKVFAMAIEGKKYSSESFATLIKNTVDLGSGVITFVIGGSYGLHQDIKRRSDGLISFSDMTFPHTFFRLMLIEQIYRAFSIIEGSAYHK